MCVFSCIALHLSWQCFLHCATLQLVSLLLLLLFFSLMVLIKPVACHLIEVKGADRYTVTSVLID